MYFTGVLNGPDIRTLIKVDDFNDFLTTEQLSAWKKITAVIANFLGNHRVENYKELVRDMIKSFHLFFVGSLFFVGNTFFEENLFFGGNLFLGENHKALAVNLYNVIVIFGFLI